jgi:hypothetical protein
MHSKNASTLVGATDATDTGFVVVVVFIQLRSTVVVVVSIGVTMTAGSTTISLVTGRSV